MINFDAMCINMFDGRTRGTKECGEVNVWFISIERRQNLILVEVVEIVKESRLHKR